MTHPARRKGKGKGSNNSNSNDNNNNNNVKTTTPTRYFAASNDNIKVEEGAREEQEITIFKKPNNKTPIKQEPHTQDYIKREENTETTTDNSTTQNKKKKKKKKNKSTDGSNNDNTPQKVKENKEKAEERRKRIEELKLRAAVKEIRGGNRVQQGMKMMIKHDLKNKKKELQQQIKKEKEVTSILLPEDSGGITTNAEEPESYELTQHDIVDAVDIRAASKAFDLTLNELGPYNLDYTTSGKYLVLAGAKGHVAMMDWDSKQLLGEFHVPKAIRDVKFLHTQNSIAIAHKRHAYIYDQNGTEMHVLKKHNDIVQLEYLPYHFLLCSLAAQGTLMYQDVSTGQAVAEIKTYNSFARVMKQNPQNAILHIGNNGGVVTMWSPNVKEPLVKILAHRAPVTSLCVDHAGQYMVTAGHDAIINIFDVRTWSKLSSMKNLKVPSKMELSQKNILALACGSSLQLWEDPFNSMNLYMQHRTDGLIQGIKFCPFEDVLGVGHAGGFSSLLIPGSGEPNFSSLEANPLQNRKDRSNFLVRSLLEKVPADTISLNKESFGTINKEELTEEEQIRRNTPGFVRLRRANKADTEFHVKLMEREKRKLAARKVEEEQKEEHEAKKQKMDEFKAGPVANTLDRFQKNLTKRKLRKS